MYSKEEIISRIEKEMDAWNSLLKNLDAHFFEKQNQKWSIAENLQHLHLSVKPLNLAFSLPRFLIKTMFGKPYRKSYDYEEIIKRYAQLLNDGAKATAAYQPKKYTIGKNKAAILQRFYNSHAVFLKKLKMFEEKELDDFFLPHPLLGKLTIREMLFFTVYHLQHHRHSIEMLYANKVANN